MTTYKIVEWEAPSVSPTVGWRRECCDNFLKSGFKSARIDIEPIEGATEDYIRHNKRSLMNFVSSPEYSKKIRVVWPNQRGPFYLVRR